MQTAVRALIDDAEAREDREVDAALDTALGIVALVGAPDLAAPGETVGVHPMRRLLPPSDLEGFADRVEHLLLGHGDALHGEAAGGRCATRWPGPGGGCRRCSAPRHRGPSGAGTAAEAVRE